MHRHLEAVDRLALAFHDRFDAAIVEVPYQPCQILSTGNVLREIPKSDALHASAHE